MRASTLSPQADRDLSEAARWITKDNPAAARAFRESVARAAKTIGEHPFSGRLRPEIVEAPYRCFLLIGFPYVIIYNAERSTTPSVRRRAWCGYCTARATFPKY